MSSGAILAINLEDRGLQLNSVEAEAIGRLRLATAIGLLAETMLPAVEATLFARPDWLAIKIQAIWFVLTVVVWAATWHSRFGQVWKPAVLLFSAGFREPLVSKTLRNFSSLRVSASSDLFLLLAVWRARHSPTGVRWDPASPILSSRSHSTKLAASGVNPPRRHPQHAGLYRRTPSAYRITLA
jgi:hypothetical protein